MAFLRRDELLFLVLWSSGYIGAKIGLPHAGTFTLLFYRYLLAIIIVAVVVTFLHGWRKPDFSTLLTGVFAHFVWLVAILKAFEFGIGAGAAALIAALQPILTGALAPFLLNERNTKLQWLGILTGLVGVVVFVNADSGNSNVALWVYSLPFIATASLTFITILERRRAFKAAGGADKNMPIFTALFWQVVVTSLLLLPFAAFVENFKANWVPEFVFSLFWLAVVTSICAYALMFRLIRLSPATRVSSLQYFIPPTTMIIAWLVFSEALSINGFAGLAITSFGFYFMHLGER